MARVANDRTRSERVAAAVEQLRDDGLTAKTIEHYELHMARAEEWCFQHGTTLLEVSANELARFVADQGVSRGSQRVIRCALAHYWRTCGRQDPPLEVVVAPRPRVEQRSSSLEDGEVQDLGATVLKRGGKPAAAASLALLLGLNGSQIAALRWSDFRADGTVEIRDSAGRFAVMEVHPALAEVLRRLKQSSPWVFPSHATAGHVRPETVYAWLRQAAADAGVGDIRADALRRSTVSESQASAFVRGAARLASTDRRRCPTPDSPGYLERIDRYRRSLRQQGMAPRTVTNYVGVVTRVERWCSEKGCTLDNISAEQFEAYVALQPRTHSTLKGIHNALLHYWRIHPREDSPLWVLRVPRKPRMICRALEDDEAKRLVATAQEIGGPKGAVVHLGLHQALRVSEIAQVRWSDFDDAGWMQVLGKGNLPASLPVHPAVNRALKDLPHTSEWVFPGRKRGGPIRAATAWDWVRQVAEQAGVANVTPHRLRHTALSVANDRTGDLRAVMEFARHVRPETTAGYTRTTARRMLDVVDSIVY